jgi:hypothetical protein
MTRFRVWIWIALAAATAGGCGYSLAGRGTFLPAYIRTIGVPLFVNNTPVFEVEQRFTERVRSEFIGRGRYEVLPAAQGVDAVLIGEIVSITMTPASFTAEQQASRYVIVMTTKIVFRDLKTDKVLWENPAMVFREEYEVAAVGDGLNALTFFGQESNAVERVASDFAKTVVSAILEAF